MYPVAVNDRNKVQWKHVFSFSLNTSLISSCLHPFPFSVDFAFIYSLIHFRICFFSFNLSSFLNSSLTKRCTRFSYVLRHANMCESVCVCVLYLRFLHVLKFNSLWFVAKWYVLVLRAMYTVSKFTRYYSFKAGLGYKIPRRKRLAYTWESEVRYCKRDGEDPKKDDIFLDSGWMFWRQKEGCSS
jgi:hypothetical protein